METFSNDYICLFEGIPDVVVTFVFTKNIEELSWKKHFELWFRDLKKSFQVSNPFMETFSNDYICLFEGILEVVMTFVFTKNVGELSWETHFELWFRDFKISF